MMTWAKVFSMLNVSVSLVIDQGRVGLERVLATEGIEPTSRMWCRLRTRGVRVSNYNSEDEIRGEHITI